MPNAKFRSRSRSAAASWPAYRVLLALAVLLGPGIAHAQVGQLVSPGPLSKAHASLEGVENCRKCHEPGRQVTADLCLSCHKPVAQRMAARRGVHRDVKSDCLGCHIEHAGPDAAIYKLDVAAFDHAREAGYPLAGRHGPVASRCGACHKTRSYLTASPTCSTCHEDVHKGTLGTDCAGCHPIESPFALAKTAFNHDRSKFPLAGAHRRVACASCHPNRTYRGVKFATCTACHKDPHRDPLGASCTSCHTVDSWRTERIDHARTGYPLKGKHATVPCAKCHTQPSTKVKLRSDTCAACHADVHRGEFKEDCASCHRETGFADASFDHDRKTAFALLGGHQRLACVKCHTSIAPVGRRKAAQVVDFRGLKTSCASCHVDPHKDALGAACERCHSVSTFRVTTFAHARFPEFFGGQHAPLTCDRCHVREAPTKPLRTDAPLPLPKYKDLPTACAACHRDVHAGQLAASCESCHSIEAAGFKADRFTHDRSTYPLTGRHQIVECGKCHRRETADFPKGRAEAVRYKGLGTTCVTCHADVHLGQMVPKCEQCHDTETFRLTRYEHRGLSELFKGGHERLECVSCHKRAEGDYPAGHGTAVRYKVGTSCASCHADPHGGSFGPECATCHSPSQWQSPDRGFHKVTVFPLEGRHLSVPCASCHLKGALKATPTRCYDCHWIRRRDDRYQLRLGSECEACHRAISWTSVRWDHGAVTGMPLNAPHRTLGCDGCHKGGTFAGGNLTCVSCHQEDYQRASPNHAAAGFPVTCEVCHPASSSSFRGATFNHGPSFPLVGQHATQGCAACHRNNVYKGTPRDCAGCHLTQYNQTQNPNHAAAGFPTTCESCHRATDSSWRGSASVNHNAFFPLVGQHATTACTTCHVNNVYKGTPTTCVGCHLAEYNGTQNPNHAAAGFSTACDACHRATDLSWVGATINHDTFFPLLGMHRTQPCAACHKNGIYQGTPRTCAPCHQTQYDQTRNPNHQAAGFPTTCDSCHLATDTTWTQGRFTHTWFPITSGDHRGLQCQQCHQDPSNYKVFTCLTCHGRSSTDQEHRGISGYRYDSLACYACHPQGKE